MALSSPATQPVDLRVEPVDEVLDRVERCLQVSLLPDSVIRKRRTAGARTDRDTWVRVERRALAEIPEQGWNGTECAARLEGVAQPEWTLAIPALADRVWRERRRDFETRDGKLMMLFVCSRLLGPYAHPEDPRLRPAGRMTEEVIKQLQDG